jgi:hypothetical protein
MSHSMPCAACPYSMPCGPRLKVPCRVNPTRHSLNRVLSTVNSDREPADSMTLEGKLRCFSSYEVIFVFLPMALASATSSLSHSLRLTRNSGLATTRTGLPRTDCCGAAALAAYRLHGASLGCVLVYTLDADASRVVPLS